LACGDQRRLTGNGSALEVVLHDYALYKSTFTLLTLLYYVIYTTCKVVSKMTYNVSNGTLNPTILYSTQIFRLSYSNVNYLLAINQLVF